MKKFIDTEQAQLYARLLGYVKPYWLPFTVGLLAAIPGGSLDGAIAWMAGQGMQNVFVNHREHLIYFVPLAVLLVAFVQGTTRFTESYCIRKVGASAIRDLRNELFGHIEKQPLSYFQTQSSGILIGRMVNDIGIVENAISQTFQSMISRMITLLSLVTVLIVQSAQLSAIALSVISLIVIPVSILGRKIRKSSRLGQEAIGDLVGVLSESIQGAKVVQSFNLEQFQMARFYQTNQNFMHNTLRAVRAEAMMSPILAMIGAAGIAGVLWVAGWQVVHHTITLGSLSSFVIALLLLYSPVKNIGRINGVVQPALAAASRVFEILDRKSELTDCDDPVDLPRGSHHIEFKNVFFQYPNQNSMVLQNIDLDIKPGQTVALVGLSGSGKSTLASLVSRFYDTTSGVIEIDGVPIPKYRLSSLRSEIAVVTQDNFLFNTSVEENIRLGRIESSFDEIQAAAKAAYCHDFIENLPQGYQTQIGERGMRLSGGQQQRLAIARAFLKNAPILILDEATSSLDNESEAMVQKALSNLMVGRTVIVIAHRLSTVRHANRIIVLDGGQIVESGTHDALVEKNAVYKRLLTAQFERPTVSETIHTHGLQP